MNKYNFAEIDDFKLWDKVILVDMNLSGYIDAVTYDKYRVKTNSGYEWVFKGYKYMIHAKDLKKDESSINNNKPTNKNKTDLRYLG